VDRITTSLPEWTGQPHPYPGGRDNHKLTRVDGQPQSYPGGWTTTILPGWTGQPQSYPGGRDNHNLTRVDGTATILPGWTAVDRTSPTVVLKGTTHGDLHPENRTTRPVPVRRCWKGGRLCRSTRAPQQRLGKRNPQYSGELPNRGRQRVSVTPLGATSPQTAHWDSCRIRKGTRHVTKDRAT
jgi:hypothetical protein